MIAYALTVHRGNSFETIDELVVLPYGGTYFFLGGDLKYLRGSMKPLMSEGSEIIGDTFLSPPRSGYE